MHDILLYYMILEGLGHYAPLLLAPAESWGPWGPAGGLRPLPLEFKIYPYTYIAAIAKIAKITCNFGPINMKFFIYNHVTQLYKKRRKAYSQFLPLYSPKSWLKIAMLGKFFKFHFLPPGRQWRHLQMIQSCPRDRCSHYDTLIIKIHPSFMIL